MRSISQRLLFLAVVLVPSYLFPEVDPLRKVAAELSDGIVRCHKTKVAILSIPYYDHRFSDGPHVVSEMLATNLVRNKKLSILERSHITQILNEIHLSESGVLDPKTTKKIGDILDAEVIVTGTLIDIGNGKTELNVRGILAENGKILAASRAVLDKKWTNKPVLDQAQTNYYWNDNE